MSSGNRCTLRQPKQRRSQGSRQKIYTSWHTSSERGGLLPFFPVMVCNGIRTADRLSDQFLSLAVITGNIGKEGSGFNYANLQSYIFDDIKEPLSYYPDKQKDFPFRRTLSMANLGSDMLKIHRSRIKRSLD